MSEIIRIVLADDHALVMEGLRSLLMAEPDMEVVGAATDGEQLLDVVMLHQPDVVITDIQMPHISGLECLPYIREMSPETRVLLLTAYTDGQTLQAVLTAGADGLLLKTDPPGQAAQAVRQVMAGQLIFPARARRLLAGQPAQKPTVQLSEREREVLALVAEGLTNAEVAERLHISDNTVKFHLQNIYQRLGVTNRTEASRWFLDEKR
ncbi:MAG TPA: response regulator transcription factor [Anaerolineae bacterium]|nr:response regulator transcription factor [Anaerolineae bacterium]